MTTLLLFEDADMREPLRLLLECAGYRVIVAEHGAAALAAMTGLRPDAVVTDWWMPVMDGVALCPMHASRIAARLCARRADVRVVTAVRCPSWDLFLSKPVSIDQIEQALHGLLGASKDGRI
ncbi:response regulator transcription factor [Paraburkholderia phymatum]|uniref:Response regulator transcription factor n=1 Tax=Paraburkholderia phymatum TaxID=148447 RepID=A0ACC6UCF6_9BURK